MFQKSTPNCTCLSSFLTLLIVSHLNALQIYNMILYFRLPHFHVSNNDLFSTFGTLILYRRSLDTFDLTEWKWECSPS